MGERSRFRAQGPRVVTLSENYLRVFHPEWRLARKMWENDGRRRREREGDDRGGWRRSHSILRRASGASTADRGLRVATDRLSDEDVGETKVKLKSRERNGRCYGALLPRATTTTTTTAIHHLSILALPSGRVSRQTPAKERRSETEGGTHREERRCAVVDGAGERDLSFVRAYSRRPKFRPGVRATTWHLDLAPATPHQPMDDGTSHDRANRSNGAVLYDARRPSPSRRTRLALVRVPSPRDASTGMPSYPRKRRERSRNITDLNAAYGRINSIVSILHFELLGKWS